MDERVAFPSVNFRLLPILSGITPSRIVQIEKMTSDSGSTLRELRNGHLERRIRTSDEEVMAKTKRGSTNPRRTRAYACGYARVRVQGCVGTRPSEFCTLSRTENLEKLAKCCDGTRAYLQCRDCTRAYCRYASVPLGTRAYRASLARFACTIVRLIPN